MLSQDISYFADGGPNLSVVRKAAHGLAEVSALIRLVYDKFQQQDTIEFAEINYQPALLFYRGGRLVTCQIFGISGEDGRIVQINSVIDPEKLKNIITASE